MARYRNVTTSAMMTCRGVRKVLCFFFNFVETVIDVVEEVGGVVVVE